MFSFSGAAHLKPSRMMKMLGAPIMQANSTVSIFLPASIPIKTKPNLEQHNLFYLYPRRKDVSLSSFQVSAALKKRVLHRQVQAAPPNPNPKEPKKLVGRLGLGGAVVSLGVAMVVVLGGFEDDAHQKAWAFFGPEGPLVEEFWDNMRRYVIYALTVSTGALYIVFQPILELLKNPISAILILAIAAGGFYIVSQVLSAMVGVSDFSYDYGY